MRDLGMEMCSVLMIAPAASRRGFPAPPSRTGSPVSSAKVDTLVVGRQEAGMVQAKSASRFSSQSRGGQSRINYEFRSPVRHQLTSLPNAVLTCVGDQQFDRTMRAWDDPGASLYELVHTGCVLFCRASLGGENLDDEKSAIPRLVDQSPADLATGLLCLLRQHGRPSARDVISAACGSGISGCLEAPARGAG